MGSEPPVISAGKRFDGSRCYADAIKNAMSNSTFSGYAGTLYLPRDDEELILGLPGGEHGDYNQNLVSFLHVVRFGRGLIPPRAIVPSNRS
jgi:hypothetical protein